MAVNEKLLNKCHLRKLTALRKSLGPKIADEAFAKWQKEQAKTVTTIKSDPVATKIEAALKPLVKDKTFKLGNQGYTIKRAKGRGVKPGFTATKNITKKK